MFVRGVLVPIGVAAFFLFAFVAAGARHPVARPPRPRAPRTPREAWTLARHLAPTAVAGYLFLLALVFVTSEVIVGERGALVSAAWGGALLACGSLPAFVLLTAAFGRRP